jgi:hypothetical protein
MVRRWPFGETDDASARLRCVRSDSRRTFVVDGSSWPRHLHDPRNERAQASEPTTNALTYVSLTTAASSTPCNLRQHREEHTASLPS